MIEFKTISAYSVIDSVEDDRLVKQIFSVMGQPDDVGDVIKNGSYTKTLQERPDRIRVLWQHDASEPPIGVPVTLTEIGKNDLPKEMRAKYPAATGGLYGEVRYLDTPRGNEVLAGIKAGAIRENSIGFDPVKWSMDRLDQDSMDYRVISEVRLWDISPVNWGAHPATQNVKSIHDQVVDTVRLIETLSDEAMAEMVADLKSGRVLSASNLEKLKVALTTLTSLLLTAEPLDASTDEESVEKSALSRTEIDALTVRTMARIAVAERELTASQPRTFVMKGN